MKKILIPFLLFTILVTRAQKNVTCGKINYTYVTNLSYMYIEEYKMIFNNEESYSEEININLKNDNQKWDESEKEYSKATTRTTIIGRNNLTPKYYYNSINGFYFRDNFTDHVIVVKEESLAFKWNLSDNEDKTIGGFSCKKAQTEFRGRTYTAWFTTDIPVSFGPYKFHGLPGLILEVYDTDKVFHIIANKVTISNDSCSIDVDKDELDNYISLESYLIRKQELIDAELSKLISRMPKGYKPVATNKDECEDCSKEIEIFK